MRQEGTSDLVICARGLIRWIFFKPVARTNENRGNWLFFLPEAIGPKSQPRRSINVANLGGSVPVCERRTVYLPILQTGIILDIDTRNPTQKPTAELYIHNRYLDNRVRQVPTYLQSCTVQGNEIILVNFEILKGGIKINLLIIPIQRFLLLKTSFISYLLLEF